MHAVQKESAKDQVEEVSSQKFKGVTSAEFVRKGAARTVDRQEAH